MQKVLILSARAGAGHIRAAEAIRQEYQRMYPDACVRHEDTLRFTPSMYAKSFSSSYENLSRTLPSVWGMIYNSFEEKKFSQRVKKFSHFLAQWNTHSLLRYIKEFQPDHIICTHFMPAEVLAPLRQKGKISAVLSVVITDFDAHTMWVHEGIDHYFTASEEVAYSLNSRIGQGAKVTASGIPLLPEFSAEYDRRVLRQKLGLEADKPLMLITGGGIGLIPVDEIVDNLCSSLTGIQIVAVAGKNPELMKKLSILQEAYPHILKVFGFVDNMHEWIAASDLVVTKSGGLTTSECLALGKPMVIVKPIPGQEERNAVYMVESGAALWAHTPPNVLYKVGMFLNHPDRLRQASDCARSIGKPYAARTVVEELNRTEQ